MGNRASIEIEGNTQNSLYLQWNGGKGSIRAFVDEAIERADIQGDSLPADFIFYLHSAITDFFNFSSEDKEYRSRGKSSCYVQDVIVECDDDNGHYLIKKDGAIDFSKANIIESNEYSKESEKNITEFFQKFNKVLLESDEW